MTILRREDHLRLLGSLIAEEMGRARKGAVPPHAPLAWTEATTLDETGIGADSLDKLSLVERVNEFYNLHRIGSEDFLVIAQSLGEWIDIVEETLRRGVSHLTFRTSGSTGEPRRIDIPWAETAQELEALDPILGPIERICAWAPPHHLYGFLFSALLPARRGVAVADHRASAPSALRKAQAGDLIVATPFHWARLLDAAGEARDVGAIGLTSGAPCPAALWRAASASPLSRMIELYGSTETGGVGWREAGDAPFQLLAHWRRAHAEGAEGAKDAEDALIRAGRGAAEAPPDHLRFDAEDRFTPAGRRDRMVQVGGVNVCLERTRAAILAHPLIADAAVRPDVSDPDRRLKAFIVPVAAPLAPGALGDLEAHLRRRLEPPARPASFTTGAALPRNDSGKAEDWEIRPIDAS
ncbi:MAG: 4-coumarate--CoA ligase [Pseudomonadota bacterium]